MTAQQRGIATALAWVCVLHGVLLWSWPERRLANDGAVWRMSSAPALSARWLPPAVARNDAVAPTPAVVKRSLARVPVRAPVAAPMAPAPNDEAQAAGPAAAAPLAPAAPEPALRADGIQRAAREAARRKGLAELSDEKLGEQPVDAQAALRNGVASAAAGDCLKGGEGGYAKSGMGLLALPLLVFDVAAGHCRK